MWELDHKEGWAPKNWWFWIMVLKKTPESPLDCKEIKSVNPKQNQLWIFIGRIDAEAEALILWSPDVKNKLFGTDPDVGKDWRQEEKKVEPTAVHYLILNVVQLRSRVRLFVTPWTAACQVSLSFTISQSLLKLMSIELVMPSNHLILCYPLLLLPSILHSIRIFSNEFTLHIRWPKY